MGLQEKIRNLQEVENKFSINSSGETLSLRSKKIDGIKKDIHGKLIEELSDIIFRKNISDYELKTKVSASAQQHVFETDFPLTHEEKSRIISEIIDDIVGFGPIEEFLRDKDVTEIMVNNPSTIYIEKFG
ncbi:MAG TPA: hypothetical protein VF347_03020, partial [Candidatus Humimicrobiaceae bacterium]